MSNSSMFCLLSGFSGDPASHPLFLERVFLLWISLESDNYSILGKEVMVYVSFGH